MKNIEKFRKVRFYQGNRELTQEELIPLGLANDVYETIEERAYQSAYDISEDWAKEVPEWSDVEEGFRRGVKEGIDFVKELIQNKINKYSEDPGGSDAIAQRKYALELILDEINKEIE